jgi:hypothetical protein
MPTKRPWLVWAEVIVAVAVMVIEVLKKQERGRR